MVLRSMMTEVFCLYDLEFHPQFCIFLLTRWHY
nr:MAG TPA: hypothetical protein [Caudoviricetes sp.]DAQ26727.1 MAG TPA: hypothetical protein [Caudoviricetes sp.]